MSCVAASEVSSASETAMPIDDHIRRVWHSGRPVGRPRRLAAAQETVGPKNRPSTTATTTASTQPTTQTATARAVLV